MAKAATQGLRRTAGTSALMIGAAVALLALPSAVLAFSSGFEASEAATASEASGGGFIASSVDPRLARSITVRALSKGRMFRFTPAATPSRFNNSVITVAVRLPANGLAMRSDAAPGQGSLRIAPGAYSLGTARGYRSFAENLAAGKGDSHRPEMPDLSGYVADTDTAGGSPSRFEPRIVLDRREKAGRAPRTFEQSDQSVDLGGSYRLSRNLNVTAGVRYSSDHDRLVPLTDGKQDSQAVYVGTRFRF